MKDNHTKSILEILDYTKTNKTWFDEKGFFAGYHTVSIKGHFFKGQRDPAMRLAKINMDLTGKKVLDIGCSNGGLLHTLSGKIDFGVGIDFNAKCINAANSLKAINKTNNIHFYTFDLDKENLSMLNHLIFGEQVDICLFFNLSIWVKRWKEAFKKCSELTKIMLFEAHGNIKEQKEQLQFVKSIYTNVYLISEQSDDDVTYAKRKMYRCENKKENPKITEKDLNYLQSPSEQEIKKAYEAIFNEQKVSSIRVFPNTHESTVAEINDDYIVKLPRPHRGSKGLKAEQAVTNFMRDRLPLPIPKYSLHTAPVLMGRYNKLPGIEFNKVRYNKATNQIKNSLAEQLSDCIIAFHSTSLDDVKQANLALSPSWDISVPLIEKQLTESNDPIIKKLLPEVMRNHKALIINKNDMVFGHFDIHGGNFLLDESYAQITALIDFGNCKIGDLHQDFSVMNLSSPDLTERILANYEKKTGRKVNRVRIQHYTTIFYLHLLAGLKKKKSNKKYLYWQKQLKVWYDYLIHNRAENTLKERKPISLLSEGWRRWVACNLIKGSSAIGLQKKLMEQGFSDLDSAKEILLAENHPYIQAGKEIFHTLEKRNWILKTYDTLATLDSRYNMDVERIKVPKFDFFVKNYYSKNLPVLLENGVNHWAALKNWTPQFLQKQYGDKTIEVQFGREKDPLYERNSSKHKKKMLMRDFIDLVMQGESNDYYMTANNTKNSSSALVDLFEDVGDFGDGYREIDSIKSANLFWFGPKGTFTPLHHDLTNNMLIQIYGSKKVTLIPSSQVPWVYNDKGVFSESDYPNVDYKLHPAMQNITPLEVTLNPGEALFIPIGWWHCVKSLDVSISLSFTNFNATNSFFTEFPKG